MKEITMPELDYFISYAKDNEHITNEDIVPKLTKLLKKFELITNVSDEIKR